MQSDIPTNPAGVLQAISTMPIDERRAQLAMLVQQLADCGGRHKALRIQAGEHLFAMRSFWPDGVYGRHLQSLGIHVKTAGRYVTEFCAAKGVELPGAQAKRKATSEANAARTNGDTKKNAVRNEAGASDAGGFIPDATPEQEAAYRASMRAAYGAEADGVLGDDFDGEWGSDLDPVEEDGEEDDRPALDHAAIANALQADRVEHLSQRPDLMAQIGPALSARLASRGVSISASGTSAAPINNDAILPRRMINAMRGEPYTVPSFTPEERERIGNTTSIVIGAPRSAPVTGEQMRLDDLYLAAETCQGRIREIKAALSTQLDGPQREAVERAFAAVEQAHAMLVIGGGR